MKETNINANPPSTLADGSGSDDHWDEEEEPTCPTCGGDGTAEYDDCPEAWGEDCPSEMNHLIQCPNCRGSGLLKDCSSC